MSSNRKAQASRSENSGAALLDIAAQLLRERGYAGTTMRGIAELAGMKAASIYHHYASKDEIVERVLDLGISESIALIRKALRDLPATADFRARLKVAVSVYLDTTSRLGNYVVATRQLANHIPPDLAERHRNRRMELDKLWADLFERGYREGAVTEAATGALSRLFMLGALNWSSEWMDVDRKSPDELAEVATALFLNGVAARQN